LKNQVQNGKAEKFNSDRLNMCNLYT